MNAASKVVAALFTVGALAVAALVVYGLVAPTTWTAERTVVARAGARDVMYFVNDVDEWPEWAFLGRMHSDADVVSIVRGEQVKGAGAYFEYTISRVRGLVVFISEDEFGLTYRTSRSGEPPPPVLEGEVPRPTETLDASGTISVGPDPEGVAITWVETGDVGKRPFGPYFAPLVGKSAQRDIDAGIEALARLAETRAE